MSKAHRMFSDEDKRRLRSNLAQFGADYRKRALAASKQINEAVARLREGRP